MNPRWNICCVLLLFLTCTLLLISCSPPAPPKEIPITTNSDEARQLFLKGMEKLDNLETVEAAGLFDQAIAKDSNFALAYIWRASAGGGTEIAGKNIKRARDLMGLVSPGERFEILMGEAANTGQTALQKSSLDSLLAMFPMDKRVKYWAGIYYRGQLDFKTAVKCYDEALSIDSLYAPVYNLKGYDLVELGDNAGAEKAFKTYIRLLPNRSNPLDSYAEFLRMQGRYDESIAQYKKVLDTDSSFVSSMMGLGDCYLFMGNAEKAREYYQQCSDRAVRVGDKLGGYRSKAISYVYESKIPEALKAFEEYGTFARKANQFSTAAFTLAFQGDVLSTFGKPAEGLKKYEDAVNLAKTAALSEAMRDNILCWSNMWFTYAYGEAKNMAKAKDCLAMYSRDVSRRGNPNEKDELAIFEGYVAMREGRYDEALAKLAAVPPSPFSLYFQGLTYAKKGDKENARKVAEKIQHWTTNGLDLAIARVKSKPWI